MTNRTNIILPALFAAGIGLNVQAAEIPTNTAQMQAMDKITGRVSVINVPVNSEVQFGSFSIVVRACRTRPPEETPENFAFVDVVDSVNNTEQVSIFRGWMLSSSPALNAVEHPVYDVWLLKCIDTDIENVRFLSPEELAARDQLPIRRAVIATPKMATEENEDVFSANNPSGEPIDLLPAAVREDGEESAADAELLPFAAAEKDENNISDNTADETPKEENAPHSLLNFGAGNNEDAPTEIRANIEIRENTANEAENVIKSDTRLLDLPAAETPAAEPQDTKQETDDSVTTAEAPEAEPDIEVEKNAEMPAESIDELPAEKAEAPQVSADTLRELEEELSRKLAD